MTEIERELRKRLGGALRAARLARQLTQDDSASLVETDPETISRFERGATLPSLVRLLSLADALGVTTASLLGGASPRPFDEWDELGRDFHHLSHADRKLAAALMRTVVEMRRV